MVPCSRALAVSGEGEDHVQVLDLPVRVQMTLQDKLFPSIDGHEGVWAEDHDTGRCTYHPARPIWVSFSVGQYGIANNVMASGFPGGLKQ